MRVYGLRIYRYCVGEGIIFCTDILCVWFLMFMLGVKWGEFSRVTLCLFSELLVGCNSGHKRYNSILWSCTIMVTSDTTQSGRRRYDSILWSRTNPVAGGTTQYSRRIQHGKILTFTVCIRPTTELIRPTINENRAQNFWGYGEGTLFEERGGNNVWRFNETINDDGVRMNLVCNNKRWIMCVTINDESCVSTINEFA